jgi:hypothetical protein
MRLKLAGNAVTPCFVALEIAANDLSGKAVISRIPEVELDWRTKFHNLDKTWNGSEMTLTIVSLGAWMYCLCNTYQVYTYPFQPATRSFLAPHEQTQEPNLGISI